MKYNRYKTKSFIYKESRYKVFGDNLCDYGYNLDSDNRYEVDLEEQVYKPKKEVNKDFFLVKR